MEVWIDPALIIAPGADATQEHESDETASLSEHPK